MEQAPAHSIRWQTLLFPRHWPMWFGMGFLWLCVKLFPYPILMQLGSLLGQLMRLLLPKRRRIVAINLALSFPNYSANEREQLARRTFSSVGMAIFENAMAWWLSNEQVDSLCKIEGLNYLTEAIKTQKPIILCTGHFTTFEFCGRALTNHVVFNAVYRSQKNDVYNFLMYKRRAHRLPQIIPREDIRGIMNALKTNIPLWLAPDQDHGRKRSVFVPFFGVAAASLSSVARLAKLTGALVVPYYSYRLPQNNGYQVKILPPLDHFPTDDVVTDTARINQIIEAGVLQAPEQYLWLHRRFKTRPIGEQKFY